MTKNEKYIFDTWAGEEEYLKNKCNEISATIDTMYTVNGGRQTIITLCEKVEYLTRNDDTRHDAITALINYAVTYGSVSERWILAKAMTNADIPA